MTKVIFGCMNIGNEKDSTINLIESIESSLLIICEDLKKFKSFTESLSIKTNAEIVQWEYDIVKNQIPKSLIEKNKIIKEKINNCLNKNKNVLIISDEGSSLLLDPGDYFLNFCLDNNIQYDILPGPSAIAQSFLHNKIFNSISAQFYFCGWFSNKTLEEKLKVLKLIKDVQFPSVMFLWSHTTIDDIEFILNNNMENNSTICINLTKKDEYVFTGSLSNIYNKIIKNEIKINKDSLISLVIN